MSLPFRPLPHFRRNIQGVVLPLTAAIARIYGIRNDDGAYPLGAFYTEHIDDRVWRHVGGIWYQPLHPEKVASRRIGSDRIQQFAEGLLTGEAVQLNNGTIVTWERVPQLEADLLPSPQHL